MPAPIDAVIDALVQARRSGGVSDDAALPQAVTTADDGYLVQAAVANELGWFDAGVPVHWKSGGASRSAVMTHAPLPPAGVWASPADAKAWPFNWRVIEAEIALRLGRPVDAALAATLDMESATALIDAMTVSIEVVDSRWKQNFKAPALMRLADLQSHGALVLGDWQPFAPRDWAAQTCHVTIGAAEQRFQGSHSLADPAFVLPAWLRHATRHGGVVPAGSVVTTGTWCGLLFAQPGELVTVTFDGIGDARVHL